MRITSLTVAAAAFLSLVASAGGCGGRVQQGSSAAGSGGGASGTGGRGAGGQGTGGQSTGAGAVGGGGSGVAGSSGGTGGSVAGAGGSGGTSADACAILRPCLIHVYECGDGVDNDGDGLVDEDDPDCLGACDNAEDRLFNNFQLEQAAGCLADCYFDGNGSPGNDDCYWSHRCDPNEAPPGFYPETTEGSYCAYDPASSIPGTLASCAELHDAQSALCHQICDAIVPNGCDCFGCCELPAGSGKHVWLGSLDANFLGSCDIAHADDPTKCHPCEPVPGCMNACDPCEICVGKSVAAAGCSLQDQCPPGVQSCQAGDPGCCPAGTYCITGCCQPLLE